MELVQTVADSGGMSLLALSSEVFGERLQGRRELCGAAIVGRKYVRWESFARLGD